MNTPYLLNTPSGVYLITNESETIQQQLLRSGSFEPFGAHFAAAVTALRPGLVVDVGANIGTFSIHLARRNHEVEIVAFEPQRWVHYQLCANTVLNRAWNVRPLNLAVGAAPGRIEVPLFDPYVERYTGSVTLDASVTERRARIPGVAEPGLWARLREPVQMVTLSEVLLSRPVSFLKIDVEGMEIDVLTGATAVLEGSRPVILSEAWDLPEFADRKAALFGFLRDRRYVVRELGNDFVALPEEDERQLSGLLATIAG